MGACRLDAGDQSRNLRIDRRIQVWRRAHKSGQRDAHTTRPDYCARNAQIARGVATTGFSRAQEL